MFGLAFAVVTLSRVNSLKTPMACSAPHCGPFCWSLISAETNSCRQIMPVFQREGKPRRWFSTYEMYSSFRSSLRFSELCHHDIGTWKERLRPSLLAAGRQRRHSGGGWRLYSVRITGAVLTWFQRGRRTFLSAGRQAVESRQRFSMATHLRQNPDESSTSAIFRQRCYGHPSKHRVQRYVQELVARPRRSAGCFSVNSSSGSTCTRTSEI